MTESSPASLLKTDVLGRVKTPAARREQLLDEFERSGASGQQFAHLVGVKYQTFASWRQQRKRRQRATTRGKARRTSPAKVRWLEAVVGSARESGHISFLPLHLPGGARMELSCSKQVPLAAALLRALEKSSAAC